MAAHSESHLRLLIALLLLITVPVYGSIPPIPAPPQPRPKLVPEEHLRLPSSIPQAPALVGFVCIVIQSYCLLLGETGDRRVREGTGIEAGHDALSRIWGETSAPNRGPWSGNPVALASRG
jgi:hypothetical protein